MIFHNIITFGEILYLWRVDPDTWSLNPGGPHVGAGLQTQLSIRYIGESGRTPYPNVRGWGGM